MLPGTMFRPDGDGRGAREFRIAFANTDAAGLAALAARLRDLPDALAAAGQEA